MEKISALSKEYVKVRFTVDKAGVAYNPTGDDVKFAFTLTNVLTGATWYQGSWETVAGKYYALCLVGPGGQVTLTAGNTYLVSVKVTDNPEIPVKTAGPLVVT